MFVLAIVVEHGIVLSKESILSHNLGGKKVWQDRISGDNDRRKRRLKVTVCSVVLLVGKSVTDNLVLLPC